MENNQIVCKNEIIDEIYKHSINQLENTKQIKRHVEIKSLYLLQATAILLTLFSALGPHSNNTVNIFFEIIFYFVIVGTVIILLLSLNDTLINGNIENNNKTFKEIEYPLTLLYKFNKEEIEVYEYKVALIKNNDECLRVLDNIIKVKARRFELGLIGFTTSMIIVTILLLLNIAINLK